MEDMIMHKKILHGMDGSEGSFKALEEAMQLAKLYGAELHTVFVEEMPQYAGTIGEVMEEQETANALCDEIMTRAQNMAEAKGIELHTMAIVGHEVKSIVELVRKGFFDLLVIGFMGRSAIYDRVMGSTCSSLVRLAPCSVLVVK
jgi:nucleotide-binding universal stress UspA family protein